MKSYTLRQMRCAKVKLWSEIKFGASFSASKSSNADVWVTMGRQDRQHERSRSQKNGEVRWKRLLTAGRGSCQPSAWYIRMWPLPCHSSLLSLSPVWSPITKTKLSQIWFLFWSFSDFSAPFLSSSLMFSNELHVSGRTRIDKCINSQVLLAVFLQSNCSLRSFEM